MLSEFKAFIARGNVLDLAVGVIIGGAFGTIVSSLTDDVIMPVVRAVTGGVDFSNHFLLLGNVPADFKGDPNSYVDLKKAGVSCDAVSQQGWGRSTRIQLPGGGTLGLYQPRHQRP